MVELWLKIQIKNALTKKEQKVLLLVGTMYAKNAAYIYAGYVTGLSNF